MFSLDGNLQENIEGMMHDIDDDDLAKLAEAMYGPGVVAVPRHGDVERKYRSSFNLHKSFLDDTESTFTADEVLAEFSKVVSKSKEDARYLYIVLLKKKLLSADLGFDWYQNAFKENNKLLAYISNRLKLFDDENNLDWYVQRFQDVGWTDKGNGCWDPNTVAKNLTSVIMGSKVYLKMSKDEIIHHLSGNNRFRALSETGELKAENGLQWCVDTFMCNRSDESVLLKVLKDTGLIKSLSIDKCIELFDDSITYDRKVRKQRDDFRLTYHQLYEALDEAELLNTDLGFERCVELFTNTYRQTYPEVASVLKTCGLLQSSKDMTSEEVDGRKAFIRENTGDFERLHSRDAYAIIIEQELTDDVEWVMSCLHDTEYIYKFLSEFNLHTNTREWYCTVYEGKGSSKHNDCDVYTEDRYRGRNFCIDIGFKKGTTNYFLLKSLYDAGHLTKQDVSPLEYLLASLDGDELVDALIETGLIKTVGMGWMCTVFGRDSLLTVKAMKGKGIWETKHPMDVTRYLTGDAIDLYRQEVADESENEAKENYASEYHCRYSSDYRRPPSQRGSDSDSQSDSD